MNWNVCKHRLRWLLTLISMIVAVGVLSLWLLSWHMQFEVRWMHAGTHRHLELARGAVTYVSTSDWESNNYFTWACSPNLSFGRDPCWYLTREPRQRGWHVRIHAVVIPGLLFGVVTIFLIRSFRARIATGRESVGP